MLMQILDPVLLKARLQKRYLFATCFALLAAVLYLRISQMGGRLAEDLTYDDVAYALDAAERLFIAVQRGLVAFLQSFVDRPPHSPFSTLLAIAAFSVGGISDVVMYAANAVILFAIALFLTSELKGDRTSTFMMLLGIVLFSPMCFRAIHDFRPDVALGFSTAVMVWWFVGGLVDDDRKLLRRAGLMLGCCLLIKPTFFAHTLAIAIYLVGLAFLARVLQRRGYLPRSVTGLKEIVFFIGLGLVIASTYYLSAGKGTFDYFWDNTRGNQAAIWSFAKETPTPRLIVDTFRQSYSLIGVHFYFSVLALIVCGVLLFLQGAKTPLLKIALTFSAALVSFAIIVFGRHRNDFFLASFQWMLMLSAIFAIAAVDRLLTPKAHRVLLALCALWLLGALAKGRFLTWNGSLESMHGRSWNEKIFDIITEHEAGEHGIYKKPLVFAPFAGPVNVQALQWIGYQHHVAIDIVDAHRSDDLAGAKTIAERASYIILPNEARAGYASWLPSRTLQAPLLKWMLADSRFKALNPLSSASSYFVFMNRAQFGQEGTVAVDGVVTLEGFRAEEGPYPQWFLPKVRWMDKDRASLCLAESAFPHYGGMLRFRPSRAGKLRIEQDDGSLVASADLVPGRFMDVPFDYTPSGDKRCLNFITQMDVSPTRENILFTRIALWGQ